jgi:circadian clock protein KaiC
MANPLPEESEGRILHVPLPLRSVTENRVDAQTQEDNANVLSHAGESTQTGIQGLDQIALGRLPRGRPTLISGGADSGKTLFGVEFLVRGATQYNEPGVLVSFEESIQDLTKNAASLGFDLGLVSRKKLFLDHVHIQRSEIEATGEYDLDALFI